MNFDIYYCYGQRFYILNDPIFYYSERYKKSVTVPSGFKSDGATGASDVATRAWWIHDKLCINCKWDDGTKLTNWQASRVLSDVLKEDGFKIRSFVWLWATFLFGCSECRKNGMFRVV